MKKLILIGITVISVMAFADTNTKKILEEYRKEALQEQSRKEVKVKPEKKSNKRINVAPITENAEEVVVEEVVEENTDVVEDAADIIEKVNFYLRNNPERLEKLEKRYKAVVGQE